jgi:conjugal transfer/entry exclusion protein
MSWKDGFSSENAVWRSVEEYARERMTELTGICTAIESADGEIRAAQAGILELQRLIALPQMLSAEAQMRGQMARRKEY